VLSFERCTLKLQSEKENDAELRHNSREKIISERRRSGRPFCSQP